MGQNCQRCNRILKSTVSQDRGCGSKCFSLLYPKEEKVVDNKQMKLGAWNLSQNNDLKEI